MSKFEGRTPDGLFVTSARKYITAWNALLVPLALKLDVEVIGYDPDILVAPKGAGGKGGTGIPVWLAQKILATAPTKHEEGAPR